MYAIIGLGKTGLSIAEYLRRQKIDFIVYDTRGNPPGLAEFKQKFPKVMCLLGEHSTQQLLQAEKIILSPGLPRTTPIIQQALAQNIPVIGDVELFVQQAKSPIIAITGTNAKGTVTTMVESILKAANKKVLIGANYGIPALDLLHQPAPDFYVLELSSFQLESTFSLQAAAAVILNIAPDHLDYHETMENYIAAKQRIYQNAKAVIFNADDKNTFPVPSSRPWMAGVHDYGWQSFSLNEPNEHCAFGIKNHCLMFHDQVILKVEELNVAGTHNWENALAASALAIAVGISIEDICSGLKNYRGLKHRCALIKNEQDIKWYNDSKGTNVGATQAALAGLGPMIQGKLILIAGGQGKGQDFKPLQPLCKQYVKALILFGQDAAQLDAALNHSVAQTIYVKNLAEAVEIAARQAQPGDAVLLSPACASWDMFKSYEERGEIFEELVKINVGCRVN